MHISLISIFPDIFQSFFATSLMGKALERGQISLSLRNPRDYCDDAHQQVDDTLYGGGDGMLLKAEPVIRSIEAAIADHTGKKFHIVVPKPSPHVFEQTDALTWSSIEHLVFVCGRYEGIDHRMELRLDQTYPGLWSCVSLGRFVLLGGEVAAMTMIEAVTRLVPGVIKEQGSRQEESYNPLLSLDNIEHPQYTKPQDVRGMVVPEVLLSGDRKAIKTRQEKNSQET